MLNMSPSILSSSVDWAEARSADILRYGTPLDNDQLNIAAKVGVAHPDQIRIIIVERIPSPVDPELSSAADYFKILGPDAAGLTLGYGIFIRKGYSDIRLLSHEFRHVHQYEQAGSIGAFLSIYIPQLFQFGYHNAPLEIDARSFECI